ncbi:MAG: hypothetical protein AB1416_02465 [Actinomycetota bacterium]
MGYDIVSESLARVAPLMDPELLGAFRRHESLTLPQLQVERAACEDRFRAWVRDPANEGRPISEAPDYLDRIALDALLERRMWWE